MFWPDTECQESTDPTCQSIGNSLYSISNCTPDYDVFTTGMFGDENPYIIQRYYSTTDYNNAPGYVYAYSADGYCHVTSNDSGFNSFRVRIAIDGAVAYRLYRDSTCSDLKLAGYPSKDLMNPIYYSDWPCDVMFQLCSSQSCGSPPYGYCGWGMSVGGPSGPPPVGNLTSVAIYEDNSCSSPPLSMVLTTSDRNCTPQNNHYDPMCESDGIAYTVSACVQYNVGGWDDIGIISDAFGDFPHLIVEKYVWCDMVDAITDVKVYRLDEKCYTNTAGSESHKLTLGRSLTITTYSDPHCVDVVTATDVTRYFIESNSCGPDDSKFLFHNAKKAFSVIAVYEDSTCSGTPSQIMFTPRLWCDPVNPMSAACEDRGNSLFSRSGCTHDYSDFAATAFAGSPFVIEEIFSPPFSCEKVGFVTAYSADGICHTHLDGFTSFNGTIDSEGTLELRTFWWDTTCSGGWGNSAVLTKDQLISSPCMMDWNGSVYSVSDCTQYYSGGWDDNGIISDSFGNEPHMIIEKYRPWQCGNGSAIMDVKMYRMDMNCYPNEAGNASYRLLIDVSVRIMTFVNENCTGFENLTTVDQSMLSASASGNCDGDNQKYYVVNSKTTYITSTIYEDSTCSGIPSLITFSPAFECPLATNSPNVACQSIGNSLFAVSNCTTNYAGFVAASFGNDNPFMVDRYHSTSGCYGDVGYVYAYSADGNCHINPDDSSSFRARIDIYGSLGFQFFRDTTCTNVNMGGGMDTYQLVSGYCLSWNCDLASSICLRSDCSGGCSRMITVGGPNGPVPAGKLSSLAIYEDNSCSSPPLSMVLTSDRNCTSQNNHYDPMCESDGIAYTVSGCVQYNVGGWDDIRIISDSFGGSLYSQSGCTTDYNRFAEMMFGENNVFAIEQGFSSTDCSNVGVVTAYSADELCHTIPGGATSFKVTIRTDGTLSLITYFGTRCEDTQSATSFSKDELISSVCRFDRCDIMAQLCSVDDCFGYWCSRKLAIGKLDPKPTGIQSAISVFNDYTCAEVPIQIVVKQHGGCTAPEKPMCTQTPMSLISMYQDHKCINDVAAFAKSRFDSTPYLIMEIFQVGSNCSKQKSFGRSVSFIRYPTTFCDDSDADGMVIGSKYINTGACYEGNLMFFGNITDMLIPPPTAQTPSPPTPKPPADIDEKTREEILFPEWLWEPTTRRIFETD
ncbi:hypothetical protein PHMEG_00011719 [Phytophthora megakarya]|uniref:Uncharacterized protein n=1 Tax=Phytophthora megakarya TaxID=4795 RepID=A0A225WC91_9STRA|nr:hypothetical protein PHMEG_00011719 [Phytophthora megakarya]